MDANTVSQGSTPVRRREEVSPNVPNLTSGETRLVREAEDGPSRVEPVQRRPLIKAFVDRDTGRPSFLIVDEEAEELLREASLEEVLEMAVQANKTEGFLIDELVF